MRQLPKPMLMALLIGASLLATAGPDDVLLDQPVRRILADVGR